MRGTRSVRQQAHESMTPQEFVAKWGHGGPAYGLNERQGAQAHFLDLCSVLGVGPPSDPNAYCFEYGVQQTGAGHGFADVWKRNHFGWEYKAPGGNLQVALRQLMMYALALENPPLLVVSDRLRIEIHTHFTGMPSERHTILLDEITRPEVLERLRWIFKDPSRFRPAKTNQQITEEAASEFAKTAARMDAAKIPPHTIAHFLTQCVFCFFAEDVDLLPDRLFERLVNIDRPPEDLRRQLAGLFETMRSGGMFGAETMLRFNGGLFATVDVPALAPEDVDSLRAASNMNWSAIDPSIFGTLFERGLDPDKRAQLGSHYTDPATIMKIVRPVVEIPLNAEWQRVSSEIKTALSRRDELRAAAAKIPSTTKENKDKFARLRTQANDAERSAQQSFNQYLEKLKEFKVLDPACGSGNFLYLSLRCLKDLEHRVNLEAEALGLQRQHDVTGPHNVLGIEINDYAAELARVTVWIGELQWRIQHGYGYRTDPVLEPLECIENRDALINEAGAPAAWPDANVVVGNPPFLGTKKMNRELGLEYTRKLRDAYKTRVHGFADLVCYWFEIAREKVESGQLGAAGLVATDSIRGGKNRAVLDQIVRGGRIFEAWTSLKWINEGAAVRVSLIAFARKDYSVPALLDDHVVANIHADLTSGQNLTTAQRLRENTNTCFVATVKSGPFDVPGETARAWLRMPNPNGRSNADVVKPWANGNDFLKRSSDTWIVDFGVDMEEAEAALYEAPFRHVRDNVRATRITNPRPSYSKYWWLLAEPIPKMRAALAGLPRFIGVPALAKHRLFVWIHGSVLPDHQLVVVARCDDTMFGLVNSRFHVEWSLSFFSALEDRPRYTPTTIFETFPFPDGLGPSDVDHLQTETLVDGAIIPANLEPSVRVHAERIARAAKALSDLRGTWLNPPEWTQVVEDVVPLGATSSPYAPRVLAKPGHEADLKKRNLTNLYNAMPDWLRNAHQALDMAVAHAYGWIDYIPAMEDEEIKRRLLSMNASRAPAQSAPAAAKAVKRSPATTALTSLPQALINSKG
jgi:type II restriction/modification system DNA methylase subunit YeeA